MSFFSLRSCKQKQQKEINALIIIIIHRHLYPPPVEPSVDQICCFFKKKSKLVFRYLFTECGWIFSSPQEAGSRTASLKRSNQVKGLRHSRSVSCLFSETLQSPWVNSAIAISCHGCFFHFLFFFFASTQIISPSMEWIQATADIFMTLPYSQENSFRLWLFHLGFFFLPALKWCSCSLLHFKVGVQIWICFLLSGVILNACRLCVVSHRNHHFSHSFHIKWHCSCSEAVWLSVGSQRWGLPSCIFAAGMCIVG